MMETVRQGREPNAGVGMLKNRAGAHHTIEVSPENRDEDSGVMVLVSSEDEDSLPSSE